MGMQHPYTIFFVDILESMPSLLVKSCSMSQLPMAFPWSFSFLILFTLQVKPVETFVWVEQNGEFCINCWEGKLGKHLQMGC